MPQIARPKYLQELIDRIGNGLIKVITGLRRSGKSYLLNEIFVKYLKSIGIKDRQIIQFDFSNANDLKLIGEDCIEIKKDNRKVDPNKFLNYIEKTIIKNKKYFLLLDEVQELGGFEYVLNGYLSDGNFDIFVTGSNAKFLSKDVITEFRGRGDEIHVLPLSFSECWRFYDSDPKKALDKYLIFGGLPLAVLAKSDEARIEYIDSQIKETYIADVLERYGSRNENKLNDLFHFIASSTSSLINPKKIADRFKSIKNSSLSEFTIASYIDHFEDVFLIKKAFRYDIKGTRYISTPYKIYFEDVGLRNSVLEFRQNELNHIMENVVYNELRYRGYKIDVGQVEYRETIIDSKTNQPKQIKKFLETDFVINKGSARAYIQSAYNIDDKEKREHEILSLKNINDSFKKIVIVNNYPVDGYDDNGIYYLDFYRFLSNENSLNL